MVIITAKRKGELMRKTSEKILRTLLAASVLATAVLSSGCLDDEEEISDSTASDNRQTSDGGNAESSEGSDNKYDGSVTGSRASKLTFSGSDGISIARKQREAEKPMGEDGTQTVFVYMCGSDLESENGLASGDNMIEFVNLPAGDYRYSFVINDIYGNVCYTGFTVFTTDDDGNVFFTPEE